MVCYGVDGCGEGLFVVMFVYWLLIFVGMLFVCCFDGELFWCVCYGM